MITRTCTKCKIIQPLTNYNRKRRDGLNAQCKKCIAIYNKIYISKNKDRYNENSKRWRDKNVLKARQSVKEWKLKINYGITQQEYNEIAEKQNWVCKICKRKSSEFKFALSVDHNHKTGIMRGLLCSNCNIMLGLAKENIQTLLEAINYLENAKS